MTRPPASASLSWLFPTAAGKPVGPELARDFLAQRDETDQQLLALVYGYGLDVGSAAWALDLDTALAHWRLRASLVEGQHDAPERLERGVAALLQAGGGPSELARRIVAGLPEAARLRLQTALAGTRVEVADDSGRPGLGVGSLVIVILAVAAFLLYGVIRDTNPLWHGKDLVRLGDYPNARLAFQELGSLPEARVWAAIAWLAEGEYEQALEALASPGAANYLGAFRPMDEPLEHIEADPASDALLPRGLITSPKPTLIYRAAPGGEVVFSGQPLDAGGEPFRPERIRVIDAREGPPLVTLPWPAGIGALQPGDYTWTVPGNELHPSAFTLLPDEQRHVIESHAAARLSYEIPYPASSFLRAHYCLRNHLYMQAGQIFAGLGARFPEQAYPREMVAEIAAALGVDPSAFLR